jgi:hypothetical protein
MDAESEKRHFTLKMKAARSFETLVPFHNTKWQHNQDLYLKVKTG